MRALVQRVRDRMASARLRRLGLVEAHPTARLSYRRVHCRTDTKLVVGAGSMVDATVLFDRDAAIVTVGERTFVGASTIIAARRVSIGSDVLISWGCTIVDHDSHAIEWAGRRNDVSDWYHGRKDWSNVSIRETVISDRVWIGFDVIVLKGVTIGTGAVVGAGSVVTRDVPAFTLVAGNPAAIIRKLRADDT